MGPGIDAPRFIWVTRGRTWGFRFLRRGGLSDPLDLYEDLFSAIADQPEAWRRVGDKVALRFPDPEDRRDGSGRVIPHDFVLFDSWAEGVDSLEAGRDRIWPEVASEFEIIWADDGSPSTREGPEQTSPPATTEGSGAG